MIFEIKMPKMGESLTEGTIVKWWKQVGDQVAKDETLLEISTDKVDSEIPSPVDGKIMEILAEENQTLEVDEVIARVETEASVKEDFTQKTEAASSEKQEEQAGELKEGEEKTSEAEMVREEITDSNGRILDVVMPKLGESLTEGTIIKWWKKPGDPVKKDETLLEVSTDKVDTEIPSPVNGKLKEILAQENETVSVDAIIARVETTEAPVKKSISQTEKPAEVASRDSEVTKKAQETKTTTTDTSDITDEIPRMKDGRFYSPLVRNIARKEGIALSELEQVHGSGAKGRVTKKDILYYLKTRVEERREVSSAKKPVISTAISYDRQRETVIPMDAVRQKIAVHMRKSLETSAHVYSVSECDMTNVMNIMHKKRPDFTRNEGFKLTVTPFILFAVTKALLDFPGVNCSLDGHNIIEKKYINLGIAVAAEKGLIVPVIKNADSMSFRGLARAVNDLVTRTRNNKLTVEDVQGSTFTVTNYGIFGNVIGLPIINQPNVAILGVGAIKKRPVVLERPEGDSIAIRSTTYISMSYDHRVVDGELGGRYMQRLVEYLEGMKEEML